MQASARPGSIHAGRTAPPAAGAADPFPQAAAAYAVVADERLLWGHRLDALRAPASLTKLLTALVLLDGAWAGSAILPVSPAAAAMPSPRAGLRTGERVRAADALAAMLVHSANDACVVLVEAAGSSRAAFAARMNAKAAALGLRSSHFVDPCGLDAPGQHSTARDLLRLARAAEARPVIAHAAARPGIVIRTDSGRELSLGSTNALIGRLPGVIGVKTGHTARAGDCLIALAERSGHRVWLVLLGSPERWWIAHRLIDEAFQATTDRSEALAATTGGAP